ncbi:hypothetical protein V2J09_023377 [Rumex salicifolius]
MVSDAMLNAPLSALSNDSSAKKKKASRYAKLKRSKLDVRREQWLSQVKSKSDMDSDGTVESPPKHGMRENLQKRTKEDEHVLLSMHDSESESLMSSSVGSSLGVGCLRKYSFGSGSGCSSSSNGCCSGSVSEEERDDGCLDDWEAIADALTSDTNQDQQHPKTENGCSIDSDPANKNSAPSTLKEASGVSHWKNTSNCAWRPDDASRPRSLPNPSKQHNKSLQSGSHVFNGEPFWSWRSLSSQPSSCPICCEDFDLTDSSFLPCPCGFRLCLFCHKRILEEDARCPGCRRQYESVSSDAALGDGGSECHPTFASIACSYVVLEIISPNCKNERPLFATLHKFQAKNVRMKQGRCVFLRPLTFPQPAFECFDSSSCSANPPSMAANRWLRPEVYPLFAALGAAVGICGFSLVRHICINPEVRVNKQNRAAGVLDNHAEGEKYSEHFLRKFVRNRSPEIMPSINSFFADPK